MRNFGWKELAGNQTSKIVRGAGPTHDFTSKNIAKICFARCVYA